MPLGELVLNVCGLLKLAYDNVGVVVRVVVSVTVAETDAVNVSDAEEV